MFERTIHITGACSQDCYFCFRDTNLLTRTLKDVKKEIDECARQKFARVAISGGEPTLHADFYKIISHAKKKGVFTVSVQSNCMAFADEAEAAKLKEAGADHVLAPLHSHLEAMSDELTRCPGGWRKTLAGIKNLHAAGLEVSINTVVNSVNFKQLPALVSFVAAELGFVKGLTISVVQPDSRAFTYKWIVPRYSEVGPYVVRAHKMCAAAGIASRNPDCGLPLCFLRGVERVSEDYLFAMERGVWSEGEKAEWRRVCGANKVKSDECARCVYDGACTGVWTRYVQIHGSEEIRAVTELPADADAKATQPE